MQSSSADLDPLVLLGAIERALYNSDVLQRSSWSALCLDDLHHLLVAGKSLTEGFHLLFDAFAREIFLAEDFAPLAE